MRWAKNSAALEKHTKTASIADGTLTEAAAMLALLSDIKKLLDFDATLKFEPEEFMTIQPA
jgi:hypothetical protein